MNIYKNNALTVWRSKDVQTILKTTIKHVLLHYNIFLEQEQETEDKNVRN